MRKAVNILLVSIAIMSLAGCSKLSQPIESAVYEVNPDEYEGMRSGGEYHSPADSYENIDGSLVIEGDPLSEADKIKREEVRLERESRAAKLAEEQASKAAEEASKAAESSKAAAEAQKAGGSSSSTGNSSGSSGNDLAGAGNVREKGDMGEVRTIIRGNDTSSYTSNSSSGGNTNQDISRKNVASIKKSGKLYDCYITIENAYRGSRAVRRLNTYNSHHAVEYDMNVPDGYELCIVSFTVEPSSTLGNKSDGVYIPKTRIKQGSGSSFGKHAILGHVLQLSDDDYDEDDEDNNNNDNTIYDLVFEIPEDTETYSVIFGESSGTTYRFKSSSLE